MSQLRKMVLLEEGELERLRQRQLKEYDPTLSAMAKAQMDLETILDSTKLTTLEKYTLLQDAQLRFKKLQGNIGPITSEVPTARVELPAAPTQSLTEPPPPEKPSKSIAEASAPEKPSKSIAEATAPVKPSDLDALKSWISQFPNVIRSNARGELVINKHAVPGSSFAQILETAVSGTKFSAPGFDKFVQGIKKIDQPLPFIKNEPFLELLVERKSEAKSEPVALSIPSKRVKSQKGKGLAAPPPGKRPRLLYLYR